MSIQLDTYRCAELQLYGLIARAGFEFESRIVSWGDMVRSFPINSIYTLYSKFPFVYQADIPHL